MAVLPRPRLLARGRAGLGLVICWCLVTAALPAPRDEPPLPPPSELQLPSDSTLAQAQRHGIFLADLDVRLLRVGVTARDKRGRPVTDLKADELRVYRDASEIPIVGFQPSAATAERDGGDSGLSPEQTYFVVLLDEAGLETPTRRELAHRLAEEMPALLETGGRVLLARQRREVHVEQTFTRDPVLLRQALDRFGASAPDLEAGAWDEDRVAQMLMRDPLDAPRPGHQTHDSRTAFESLRTHSQALALREQARMKALGRFLHSLSVLPGSKAVVHVSAGFHLNPSHRLVQTWASQDRPTETARKAELEGTHYHLRSTLDDLVTHANSSGSSFFALHLPRQLPTKDSRRAVRTDRSDAALRENGSRGQSLLLLAEGTAGTYHRGLQQVDELIERVLEDLPHRYGLYLAAGEPDPDRVHELRIETTRPGVRLAYLDAYRDKTADRQVADATLAALFFDLASNPLDARIELGPETKSGRNYLVPMTVKVPLDRLILLPEARLHRGRLSVFVASRDAEGHITEPWRQDVPVTLSNEELMTTITRSARYLTELRLPPGPHKIAIGVRDDLAAVGSTFNIQLHIGARAGRSAEVP